MLYLRDHPDFLDRHPDALWLLRPPSRREGDGVLDFQQFMLERLRRDLLGLRDEQASLVATSRGNLASQARVHRAALAMLRAHSFEQLLQIVTTDTAVLIDVDVVTIGIESAAAPTMRPPSASVPPLPVSGGAPADRAGRSLRRDAHSHIRGHVLRHCLTCD